LPIMEKVSSDCHIRVIVALLVRLADRVVVVLRDGRQFPKTERIHLEVERLTQALNDERKELEEFKPNRRPRHSTSFARRPLTT